MSVAVTQLTTCGGARIWSAFLGTPETPAAHERGVAKVLRARAYVSFVVSQQASSEWCRSYGAILLTGTWVLVRS